MNHLEISGLEVSFRDPSTGQDRRVVDGVSLVVPEGSFTALVGESGSGKSVTALSVCRLIEGARLGGQVYLRQDNRTLDLSAMRPEALARVRGRRIAYVFQDPDGSLDPLWRIGDQLAEARLVHGLGTAAEAAALSRTLLEYVRIPDPGRVLGAYPHELSGGMKQRVMIAMALAAEPRYLIADEPTTALDAVNQEGILELLETLRRERGMAIWLITHDLPTASACADRIHVMEKGRIVESIAAGQEPRCEYTRRLFGAQLAGGLRPKSEIPA